MIVAFHMSQDYLPGLAGRPAIVYLDSAYSVFQVACPEEGVGLVCTSNHYYSVFHVGCPEEIKNGSWPCLYR